MENNSLTKKVEELEAQLLKLIQKTSFNEMSSLVRYDKNVSLSPGNRLRLEPLDSITSIVPESKQGEMVGGALQGGTNNTVLISNIISQSLGVSGVWIPVSNSNTPFLITLGANTNNLSIKVSSGVQANYILLANSTGGAIDLTGIVGTEAGHEIVLLNMSAQNIVIKNNVTSTAANRFFTLTAADVTLAQHQSIRLRYRADVIVSGTTYITETRTGWQETN